MPGDRSSSSFPPEPKSLSDGYIKLGPNQMMMYLPAAFRKELFRRLSFYMVVAHSKITRLRSFRSDSRFQ